MAITLVMAEELEWIPEESSVSKMTLRDYLSIIVSHSPYCGLTLWSAHSYM